MIFQATVEHWHEWTGTMEKHHMFIAASSIVDAVTKISDYFGEDTLDNLYIEPFAPSDFIMCSDRHEALFNSFKTAASEDVLW